MKSSLAARIKMEKLAPLECLGNAYITPQGGQLCWRALAQGQQAVVGLLHLGKDTRIEPGRPYLLVEHEGRIGLSHEPIAEGLTPEQESYGIGGLLSLPLWPQTRYPNAIAVRFLEAFEQGGAWTVYGAGASSPQDMPDHRWVSVDQQGQVEDIDPPVDARGQALLQLLVQNAIWPHPDGTLWRLSGLAPTWRQHMHRLHLLMAEVGRDHSLVDQARTQIMEDEGLRQLHVGAMDLEFCAYLAQLQSMGHLSIDCPEPASEFSLRRDRSRQALEQSLELQEARAARSPSPRAPSGVGR